MKIVISFGVKEQPKYGKIPSGQAGKNFRLSDSDRGKHRSQNHPEVGHGPRPAQRHRRHEMTHKGVSISFAKHIRIIRRLVLRAFLLM